MKSLAIVALVLALAPAAYADGIFVWRLQDQDIREPQQKAFIIHDQGWEDLVLSVKYEGAAADFGWIVPLPAKPQMEAVDSQVFEALSKATQDPCFGKSQIAARMDMTAGIEIAPKVITERVGIYDISILEGGNAAGVQAWLTANAFLLPEGAEPTLAGYLQGGWVFAAMHIASEEQTDAVSDSLAAGSTQPVHFRFPAAEPVFPLKISSLGGHESEILLYVLSRQGWVPEPGRGIPWESNCWSRVPWRWFRDEQYLPPRSPFLERTKERFTACPDSLVLTKSRAVVQPSAMQDVTFRPYPCEEFLCGGDVRQRAEAATFIGFTKPRQAASVLEEFLAGVTVRSDPWGDAASLSHPHDILPEQDARSALWALGQVGGSAAVSALAVWAGADNLTCQIEAMAALQELEPRVAADLCLEQMLRRAPREGLIPGREQAFIDLCADHLLVHGGADHVSGLKKLRQICRETGDLMHKQTRRPQGKRYPSELEQWSVFIAAACGDSASCAELEQELRQAAVASLGWNNGGGGYNFYPAAMVPGVAIIYGHLPNGPVVERMTEKFANRPAVRDSLFRRLAQDTDPAAIIPDDFRAILLAKVAQLEPADEGMLQEIWDRAWALRGDQAYRSMPANLEQAASVEWMVQALAAAYALGAQGRCAALDRLWTATGWDEPIIKGEIAVAATLTKDSAAVPLVLDYVKTRWGQRVNEPGFVEKVEASEQGVWGWPREVFLDEIHRELVIGRFLADFGKAQVRSLAADPAQPSLLRLYLSLNSQHAWDAHWCDLQDVLWTLTRDFPSGNLRSRIDRQIESIDKIYLRH